METMVSPLLQINWILDNGGGMTTTSEVSYVAPPSQ